MGCKFYSNGNKHTRIRTKQYVIDVYEEYDGHKFYRKIMKGDRRYDEILIDDYFWDRYRYGYRLWIFDGIGVELTPNGDKYEGEWVYGERQGSFICTTAKGKKYKQEYKDDKLISSIKL